MHGMVVLLIKDLFTNAAALHGGAGSFNTELSYISIRSIDEGNRENKRATSGDTDSPTFIRPTSRVAMARIFFFQ